MAGRLKRAPAPKAAGGGRRAPGRIGSRRTAPHKAGASAPSDRGVRARGTDIAAAAKEQLGFATLRPGQEEAVRSVLSGRDTLVVMPTGAGKSAIYQLSALLIDGPTVVVSPLIALQRDQVGGLGGDTLTSAGLVNSTEGRRSKRETLAAVLEGGLEFLFLAPEQFNDRSVLQQLRAARPSLFVIDEAHCISEWGHGFRPEYLRLGSVIDALGRPRILALTATASEPVRVEIVERLGMRDPAIFVHGFDRPNIRLSARHFRDEEAKERAFLEAVTEAPRPGIVYVSTRQRAETLAARLEESGLHAVHYHGGLKAKERGLVQDEFMAGRRGDANVIVATSAFGMGVDKANVRFVFHYDPSDSLDSYYQEIGRAGRDGKEAEAVLFYRDADLAVRRFFAGSGRITTADVEGVLSVLAARQKPATLRALKEESGLSQTKLDAALGALADLGAVRVMPNGQIQAVADAAEGAAEKAAARQESRRHRQAARLEVMRTYALVAACRRRFLLQHFGERTQENCGHCDNCERGLPVPKVRSREPFAVKSWVMHPIWGKGLVLAYDHHKVRILFDAVGEKTLALAQVKAGALLRPMS